MNKKKLKRCDKNIINLKGNPTEKLNLQYANSLTNSIEVVKELIQQNDNYDFALNISKDWDYHFMSRFVGYLNDAIHWIKHPNVCKNINVLNSLVKVLCPLTDNLVKLFEALDIYVYGDFRDGIYGINEYNHFKHLKSDGDGIKYNYNHCKYCKQMVDTGVSNAIYIPFINYKSDNNNVNTENINKIIELIKEIINEITSHSRSNYIYDINYAK